MDIKRLRSVFRLKKCRPAGAVPSRFVFLLSVWAFLLGVPALLSAQPTGLDPVAVLKAENTVREKTNRNDHARITVFNKTHHPTLPANASYCGTSLEYAIKKAGWGLDVEYAPIARNWSRKKKHIVWSRSGGSVPGKKPARNDVVVFYYQGRWHVGLLEDWQEGSIYCLTVEGNTSDRGVSTIKKPTGREGVYDEKLRNKKDIYCIVRPYYIPIY